MFDFSRMTWPEIRDIIPRLDAVLLPLGSIEQHGFHLPVDNDYYTAQELARIIQKKGEEEGLNLAVSFSLPVGCSHHHMAFPGTVSLSEETFSQVLKEVFYSYYQHGVRRILIVNGHGGNAPGIEKAIIKSREDCDWDMLEPFYYWDTLKNRGSEILESGHYFHACEGETSIALALKQRVLMERAVNSLEENSDLKKLNILEMEEISVPPFHHLTNSGVIGNSKVADKEKGDKLLGIITMEAIRTIQKNLTLTGKTAG